LGLNNPSFLGDIMAKKKKKVFIEGISLDENGILVTLKYTVLEDLERFIVHRDIIVIEREKLNEENVIKAIQEKETERAKHPIAKEVYQLRSWLGKEFVIEVDE